MHYACVFDVTISLNHCTIVIIMNGNSANTLADVHDVRIVHDIIGRHVRNNQVQYRVVFEHSISRNSWENQSIVSNVTDTLLLSKISALNSYADLPVQHILCNANTCYNVYKRFLRDNCNSSRNRSAGHHWDGTFEREGYVMHIAECICCHCKDENGNLLYLVHWGDWRKFDPSWITCEDLIHQIKSEYIYLLLTFDDCAESFT